MFVFFVIHCVPLIPCCLKFEYILMYPLPCFLFMLSLIYCMVHGVSLYHYLKNSKVDSLDNSQRTHKALHCAHLHKELMHIALSNY